MVIGFLRVDLLLPGCNSLKDKRSVLKRTIAHLRKTFNVGVGEIGDQDIWRRCELGIVTIATRHDTVERTLDDVVHACEMERDLQVLEVARELL